MFSDSSAAQETVNGSKIENECYIKMEMEYIPKLSINDVSISKIFLLILDFKKHDKGQEFTAGTELTSFAVNFYSHNEMQIDCSFSSCA